MPYADSFGRGTPLTCRPRALTPTATERIANPDPAHCHAAASEPVAPNPELGLPFTPLDAELWSPDLLRVAASVRTLTTVVDFTMADANSDAVSDSVIPAPEIPTPAENPAADPVPPAASDAMNTTLTANSEATPPVAPPLTNDEIACMLQSTRDLPLSDVGTLSEQITAQLSDRFPDAPNNKVFDLLMSLLLQTAISAHRRQQILADSLLIHHDLINTLSRAILVPYNDQTKVAQIVAHTRIRDHHPRHFSSCPSELMEAPEAGPPPKPDTR
ncbi:hypothetical protein PTTG_25876 [Puccinia triticina 1-1 BBBD Race 1]|uniref:Uncharacterized protein n=1 Tax=Puccinia triticina (isolate 1-1 / race 1 (BBBD)) TaxID=630390 RepID=A0A180GZJ3_PUCT1|nr:hypothetical protein PTTG_25876 [Puccinia triticina 1-1 BBBD Race 1]